MPCYKSLGHKASRLPGSRSLKHLNGEFQIFFLVLERRLIENPSSAWQKAIYDATSFLFGFRLPSYWPGISTRPTSSRGGPTTIARGGKKKELNDIIVQDFQKFKHNLLTESASQTWNQCREIRFRRINQKSMGSGFYHVSFTLVMSCRGPTQRCGCLALAPLIGLACGTPFTLGTVAHYNF